MTDSRSFTRRQLYELVWSKPIATVAAELGLSDVAIAKICSRHRIPTPPRGYWAKLQAGKKAKQAPFAETDDPEVALITITGNFIHLPETTRAILEAAKAKRNEARAQGVPATELSHAAKPTGELHQSIRSTAKILRKAKPDSNGAVRALGAGLCGVEVSAASVERVVAFLDQLALELDKQSTPLHPAGERMRVSIGLDSIDFTVKENKKREKHVPTAEDLVAEDRRQKKLQLRWDSPGSWGAESDNLFERAYPEFDVIYTGELVFQVEGYGEGVRRRWADGKTQTLEGLLEDILVGLDVILSVRKAEREAREERQRQWDHLTKRRELARRRSKREEDRSAYLRGVLHTEAEIDRLRYWLDTIASRASADASGDFDRLVDWARVRLSDLEAAINPVQINQDLRAKKLFPTDDDLHDPEGDPPGEARFW